MAKRKHKVVGLQWKRGKWHVDKIICGRRINQTLGVTDADAAEEMFYAIVNKINRAIRLGESLIEYTVAHAFNEYLKDATHKSVYNDKRAIKRMLPFLGKVALKLVSNSHEKLKAFIKHEQTRKIKNSNRLGVANASINRDLSVLRRCLHLASKRWRDSESGLPWLACLPPEIISLPTEKNENENFKGHESTQAYILTFSEEKLLLKSIPSWLQSMLLIVVNTGARDQEICKLQWSEERYIDEISASVFILPPSRTKNRKRRYLILNSISREIIENQRGQDPIWVFPSSTKKNCPVSKMRTTSFVTAWLACGLPSQEKGFYLGPHCFRHTFTSRAKKFGVTKEIRRNLLGHGNEDVTDIYSDADVQDLIDATEKVVSKTNTTFLRTLI